MMRQPASRGAIAGTIRPASSSAGAVRVPGIGMGTVVIVGLNRAGKPWAQIEIDTVQAPTEIVDFLESCLQRYGAHL